MTTEDRVLSVAPHWDYLFDRMATNQAEPSRDCWSCGAPFQAGTHRCPYCGRLHGSSYTWRREIRVDQDYYPVMIDGEAVP